jgi:integrase
VAAFAPDVIGGGCRPLAAPVAHRLAFEDLGPVAPVLARGADLPPIRHTEAPYFTPEVVDKIVDAVPERYAGFVAVQGVLGARFGEAAALRRRSVDLLRRRLVVSESLTEVGGRLSFGPTKTHATRALPLPAALSARIEEHLEGVRTDPDALLFTSTNGYPSVTGTSFGACGIRPWPSSVCRSSGCTRCVTRQRRA